MERDTVIFVKGNQTPQDGEGNIVELMTEGKYYKKGNSYYIVYKETEISGMEGTTTTLKVDQNKVTLLRYGNNEAQMVFEKDKTNRCVYRTLYGDFDMSIHTRTLDIEINDDQAQLFIDYSIEMEGMNSSQNILTIKVK